MAAAMATDLAHIPSVEVHLLRDASIEVFDPTPPDHLQEHLVQSIAERNDSFDRLASAMDQTLVIAPETNNILLETSQRVLDVGGRLLSPHPEVIAIAGDKWLTHQKLRQGGVRVPPSVNIDSSNATEFDEGFDGHQLICKPRDGAGSEGIRRISPDQVRELNEQMMVEGLVNGIPTSVAALSGPSNTILLAPMQQFIAKEDGFAFHGGRSLLHKPELCQRAHELARAAIECLPNPTGYLGVDLVLGHKDDPSDDTVIEINPRITTSYIGLRAMAKSNLAEAMVSVGQGHRTHIEFHDRGLQFFPNGEIEWI